MREFLLGVVVGSILGMGFTLHSARVTLQDVQKAHALECARSSEGADMDIIKCYTDRGLEPPEDLT